MNQIKKIRLLKGLSQAQVAKLLNYSTRVYSALEAGELYLDKNKKLKLAYIFPVYNNKGKTTVDELKKYRKNKGFTQSKMANLLGISSRVYSIIEAKEVALTQEAKTFFHARLYPLSELLDILTNEKTLSRNNCERVKNG